MTDIQTSLRQSFADVAESTEIPALPLMALRSAAGGETGALATMLVDTESDAEYESIVESGDRPSARRGMRRAIIAASTSAVILAGIGVAAAADAHLPNPVLDAIGWGPAPDAYNPDNATSRMVLQTGGPDGQAMELWLADANDHGFCISLLSASHGPRSVPDTFGGECSGPKSGAAWTSFGGEMFTSHDDGPDAVTTFAVHVPGAAHVRLDFQGGSERWLPVGGQWTAGWFSANGTTRKAMLVGYDTNGTKIGSAAVPAS